jgi:hypothetical protein
MIESDRTVSSERAFENFIPNNMNSVAFSFINVESYGDLGHFFFLLE